MNIPSKYQLQASIKSENVKKAFAVYYFKFEIIYTDVFSVFAIVCCDCFIMETSGNDTVTQQTFNSPPKRRRSTFFERRDSLGPFRFISSCLLLLVFFI